LEDENLGYQRWCAAWASKSGMATPGGVGDIDLLRWVTFTGAS
jgi:hypothetical protein